jgi:hypothetical protein
MHNSLQLNQHHMMQPSQTVLNFVPKPSQILSELVRAVHIGGTVAVYVWDYADPMRPRYFWNASVALDKAVVALDEGQRFPLCRPEPFEQLFRTTTLKVERIQRLWSKLIQLENLSIIVSMICQV